MIARLLLALALLAPCLPIHAQRAGVSTPAIDTPPPYRDGAFIHPGGLHTRADLDRMKAKVAAKETPWIEGWEALVSDPKSRTDYRHSPRDNMGASRQTASRDAHAAYLNFMRGYISGDDRHIDHAIRICNDWSAAVDQVPHGGDIPGLAGIPIAEFALVGELLCVSPRWKAEDCERFKNMMTEYLYPVCHDFLVRHNGAHSTHYWANWDICNIGALIAIGVLCDRPDIYDEGVTYFLRGEGMGSIMNAVYKIHPNGLGQWQESGRDQPHARLGVGMLAHACQVAWNQNLDLFGVAENRLLAGAEYAARTTLGHEVPYTFYTNSQPANNYWLSNHTTHRLNRPIWEILYNHYVVRRGLEAPHTAAMAHLIRPEHGNGDQFGYGTLTFTLDAEASPYPPFPAPDAPTGPAATAGVGRVELTWTAPPGDIARGYEIHRATAPDGRFATVHSTVGSTSTRYADADVKNGTRYFYQIAAVNQSGTGPASDKVEATPLAAGPLPPHWTHHNIGEVREKGSTAHSPAAGNTIIVSGNGRGIGGRADACACASFPVTGGFTLTARLIDVRWAGGRNRVGLMVRETMEPGSKAAFLTLGDAGARFTRFGVRASAGGNTSEHAGNAYTWLPVWYRLQRAGDTLTATHSTDGENWFPVGEQTLELPANVQLGFAVASDGKNVTTATFDHVTIDAR